MPTDVERRYIEAQLAARYPIAEKAKAAPSKEKKEKNAETMAALPMDALAGALKGLVAQTLGFSGDIRELVNMVAEESATKVLGERSFMTTEEMRALLPKVIPPSEDIARDAAREAVATFAEEIGTLLGPAALVKKGTRKAFTQAVGGGALAGASAGSAASGEERRIRYNAKGERRK